jgi:hypothetical protein
MNLVAARSQRNRESSGPSSQVEDLPSARQETLEHVERKSREFTHESPERLLLDQVVPLGPGVVRSASWLGSVRRSVDHVGTPTLRPSSKSDDGCGTPPLLQTALTIPLAAVAGLMSIRFRKVYVRFT